MPFNGAPLKIVGQGPELARLQRRAGPDVQFLGWRPDDEIRELYQQASAVLLPGVEDFGMVPVEAQACGRPVVAVDGRPRGISRSTAPIVREDTP